MIGALITCYNESRFLNLAIKSTYPFVDRIALIEGAYQESIDVGADPRSNDGTLDIIDKWREIDVNKDKKLFIRHANEQTDKDQRNFGTKYLKDMGCDYLMIVDGDEMYPRPVWSLIHNFTQSDNPPHVISIKSQTFINDPYHYCWQEFPRLFKLDEEFRFVNDNYGQWKDANWGNCRKSKIDIPYYHFAFMKSAERFWLKKKWWQTRFGPNSKFKYDWYLDDNKKVAPKNHKVYQLDRLPNELKIALEEEGLLYEKV